MDGLKRREEEDKKICIGGTIVQSQNTLCTS